jgi:hypothetical protein
MISESQRKILRDVLELIPELNGPEGEWSTQDLAYYLGIDIAKLEIILYKLVGEESNSKRLVRRPISTWAWERV